MTTGHSPLSSECMGQARGLYFTIGEIGNRQFKQKHVLNNLNIYLQLNVFSLKIVFCLYFSLQFFVILAIFVFAKLLANRDVFLMVHHA